jgi:crotonobetainyl-CoA:carnitine CoA-transferase CaiB-like acyl-CoA transferase
MNRPAGTAAAGIVLPVALAGVAVTYGGIQRATAIGLAYAAYGGASAAGPVLLTLFGPTGPRWPAFAAAVGRADLVDDPRFATTPARRANVRALMDILDATFATDTLAHWRAALDAAGITFGPVGTTNEIAADAQALAVGALRPVEGTPWLTVDSPFTVEGSPKVAARPAPAVGEHSSAILREVGFGEAEIAALKASGAVAGQ